MKRFPWHLYKAEGWRCLLRHINAANAPHCRECGLAGRIVARRDM